MAAPHEGVPRVLRAGLAWLAPSAGPIDLRFLGRTLLHAAVVGLVAGAFGAGFLAVLELGQRLLLEALAGYEPIRASGESAIFVGRHTGPFRPWLLALLPALGGLASGLVTRLAPECAGGGGDAAIEAYHEENGRIRARVIPVKALASVLTLASGGSGGREGPTMHIGAAIGSQVGRWLPASARDRRVLLVAGVAAGMAAVFRTPLGAALLAVEMLYRDDFESDALVPAILASVIAYALVISLYGETTLFGGVRRFPFVPGHLPLYALLAVLVSVAAAAFARGLRVTAGLFRRLPGPGWLRPAVGGLLMGALATGALLALGPRYIHPGQGIGMFGGGYGAVQAAISGAPSLPEGWALVLVFLAVAAGKILATSLTIGSGGSAGDFAPSLTIGGLLGAAFGQGAALLLHDPRIDPSAFALVGMGTFYGGIAHVPLSALVLVSELAGSYDLLVPMMLATGVAFVALRRTTLYPAQPASQRDSPVHPEPRTRDLLARVHVRDVMVPPEVGPVGAGAPVRDALRALEGAKRQRVVVVLGSDGRPSGLARLEVLRAAALDPHLSWAVASDAATPWSASAADATLAEVADVLAGEDLPQVPVLQGDAIVGYAGAVEIARALLQAIAEPDAAPR